MLYHILLHHSSFAPRRETLQETSFTRQAPLAYTFDAQTPGNMRRYMLEDDEAWQAFLASLSPIRPLLRIAAWMQPVLSEHLFWAWYLAQASSWCAANLVHAYRRAPASGSLRKHLATSSTSTSCFTASPKPRCSTSTATRWTSTAHTCGADKSTRRPIGRGSLWRISARNTVATQFALRVQLRNVPKRCD
jgi:hypothetical protein